MYIGRINEGLFQFKTEGEDNMTTQIIVVVGASIATVVLMFVLGKMADGKSGQKAISNLVIVYNG